MPPPTRPAWTFRRRVGAGLGLTAILAAAIGGIAVYALTQVVQSKDRVISVDARILADARELEASQANKSSSIRGFLLTGNKDDLVDMENHRKRFAEVIARLRANVDSDQGRRQLDEIVEAESTHQQLSERVIGLYQPNAPISVMREMFGQQVARARDTLDNRTQAFTARQERRLELATQASSRTALQAATFVLIATLALLLGAGVLAFVITEERQRLEVRDVEARAALEVADARAALVRELERKNRELEAFSYSVSHDLRAPLRAMAGFSHALLEDYSGRLDEPGRDYLRRISLAARRMGDLIDALLQLSRVERAELHRSRINLSDVARAAVAELQRGQPDRHVDVAIEDNLITHADAHLMRVALDNLFDNAWKFTANTSQPSVSFHGDERGDDTVFVVKDNGAGFDMTYADKLFKPFQRLHLPTEFPGTGIGLATVHRIVERHGGRVWADATVSGGTAIYFSIPTTSSGDRL